MKNLYLACKKTHLADSILLDWTLPMSFLSEIRLNLMTLERSFFAFFSNFREIDSCSKGTIVCFVIQVSFNNLIFYSIAGLLEKRVGTLLLGTYNKFQFSVESIIYLLKPMVAVYLSTTRQVNKLLFFHLT